MGCCLANRRLAGRLTVGSSWFRLVPFGSGGNAIKTVWVRRIVEFSGSVWASVRLRSAAGGLLASGLCSGWLLLGRAASRTGGQSQPVRDKDLLLAFGPKDERATNELARQSRVTRAPLMRLN